MKYSSLKHRVVVTGLGLVTPLGVGVSHNWQSLLSGSCGIRNIFQEEAFRPYAATIPCHIAARVPGGDQPWQFNVLRNVGAEFSRNTSQSMQFAMAAASEALLDAQWADAPLAERRNTGVSIGSGMVGIGEIREASEKFAQVGYRKVSPYFVPLVLPNTCAGKISSRYGFHGPNHSVSTACATGAHSIGDAYLFIQNGLASVMVAGGTEAAIDPLSIAGFCRLKALATKFNDAPQISSRPFDGARQGFVMGEGAGVLVLESLQHAVQRRAHIYCEVVGYGMSGDAHHITAPPLDGFGARLAMERSLEAAACAAHQVDYINAHATSTPLGDAAEHCAISALFRGCEDRLVITSTKGATGHLLGAAGAVEAIFTILAVHQNAIPPTLNLENPDPEFCFQYAPKAAIRNHAVNFAMSNSFGFGGTNTCLLFKKWI